MGSVARRKVWAIRRSTIGRGAAVAAGIQTLAAIVYLLERALGG